jgi:hypothetical protein
MLTIAANGSGAEDSVSGLAGREDACLRLFTGVYQEDSPPTPRMSPR